jgi:CubicO group peptidase (beta-lactamase class C family)
MASDRVWNETIEGELGGRLDEYVVGAVEHGFSGGVLVAKEGEVALHRAYGWADKERNLPMTNRTAHDVGSVTKMFTAAAILELEEQGKLDVAGTIAAYFDDVPEDKAGITLHQLLTHTAGLPLYSGEDYDPASRDALVRWALDTQLESPPGTKYRYSNPSSSLLGAIVEAVSGRQYEEYVYERFFRPAGMLSTGYVIPRWDRNKVARGYADGQGQGNPLDMEWMPDGPGWNLRANGGMLSNAGDLYLWFKAMHGRILLSENAWRKMATPYVLAPTTPPNNAWSGYGVYLIETARGTRIIARSGTSRFGHTDAWYFADEGVVVIVLGNIEHNTVWKVRNGLVDIIFGADAATIAQ